MPMITKLIKQTNNPFLRLYGNLVSKWTIKLLQPAMMDDKELWYAKIIVPLMHHSLRYSDFYKVTDWELEKSEIQKDDDDDNPNSHVKIMEFPYDKNEDYSPIGGWIGNEEDF